MLQYTAVNAETLELLKLMMRQKCLDRFNLVGGTALALQLGHRLSVDLDFFTFDDFETNFIVTELQKDFKFEIVLQKSNSLILNVDYPLMSGMYIKVDILKYPYVLIDNLIESDGIRLLSMHDIIPMKLSAIANRGAKKDFYDIYFLLNHFTIKEMLYFFTKKFPTTDHFHILKSLTYFEDAEEEVNPKVFKKVTWKQVKNKIEKTVRGIL